MAINKIFSNCDEAVADIFDGATIMIGGFGSFGGLPISLIVALARQGAKKLTIIANMGGVGFELSHRIKPEGYQDSGILFENGQVTKFIGSVPALGGMPPTSPLENLHNEGKVDIEMVPQGTLAERIRCGASGLAVSIRLWESTRSLKKVKRRKTLVGRNTFWNCRLQLISP